MRPHDKNTAQLASQSHRLRLSETDIQSLGTTEFLAWIGKRNINPGGIACREKILQALRIQPDSHVLEIGSGNGHAACRIAQQYRCKVVAVDLSPARTDEAMRLVSRLGLEQNVACLSGDVHKLEFPDNSFDCVFCESVLAYTRHDQALQEIRRVLKNEGRFAGQELCWRRVPPDPLRQKTQAVHGEGSLELHTKYGWIGQLSNAGFEVMAADEHPFEMFSFGQLLRDEGWLQSLRIGMGLMMSGAKRRKMASIRDHFHDNAEFFNYLVFTAGKSVSGWMRSQVLAYSAG
jgi:SAM-dependent methyltransferase